jgi:hypothetical protein
MQRLKAKAETWLVQVAEYPLPEVLRNKNVSDLGIFV